jgi:hypothetical protein
MAELKLKAKNSHSLRQIIQSALSERLHSIKAGIKRTEERLQEFETKYQLSTDEFIKRFNNDEFSHSFDFDEWIGESRMLAHLRETKEAIEEVEFVN